jgi:hypothetical protein
MPLHASYNAINDNVIEFFPTPQRNEHRMIGYSVITCLYEGNWDKEPPIFELIIKYYLNAIMKKVHLEFMFRNAMKMVYGLETISNVN